VRARLLRQDVRLLTLTGTGGIGKTRLALALAATLLDAFGDGIWFVDLSTVTSPAMVTPAIAQVLGVREAGQQPTLEALKIAIRGRQLLLVLDNFEQVVLATADIAELLVAAPSLKVLVTSRAPLHISAEHEFPVPPLGLPDLAHPAPSDELSQYEAVALFIQRSHASRPATCSARARTGGAAAALARGLCTGHPSTRGKPGAVPRHGRPGQLSRWGCWTSARSPITRKTTSERRHCMRRGWSSTALRAMPPAAPRRSTAWESWRATAATRSAPALSARRP
ncbi:MAG: NB-ARC domain-containing protein, partial [Chloroflexota bacterium]|nr:NB-ARC domain-containing protein [Chloroflexota bacterium]